jgi:hypothetical protein
MFLPYRLSSRCLKFGLAVVAGVLFSASAMSQTVSKAKDYAVTAEGLRGNFADVYFQE